MKVWDGLSSGRLSFVADDAAPPQAYDPLSDVQLEPISMAWMTENLNLQRALLTRLRADSDAITLCSSTKVQDIQRDNVDAGGWPVLTLSDGKQIRARLLVGADGINSPVRKYAKIETYGWMYDTHGLVATLKVSPLVHQGSRTAWQRFLPTGPIAFLPVREFPVRLRCFIEHMAFLDGR